MNFCYIITSSFLITGLSNVNFLEVISSLHKSLDPIDMLDGRSSCDRLESLSIACSASSFFSEFGLVTKESFARIFSSRVFDSPTVLKGNDISSVINAVGVLSKLLSGSISVRLFSSFIICTSGFAVDWLVHPDLFKFEVCSFGGENTNEVFALSKSLSESKQKQKRIWFWYSRNISCMYLIEKQYYTVYALEYSPVILELRSEFIATAVSVASLTAPYDFGGL